MKTTENVYFQSADYYYIWWFNTIADEKVLLHCQAFAVTPEWILLLQFHDSMAE